MRHPDLGKLLQVNQFFATSLGYLISEVEGARVEDFTDFGSRGGLADFEKVVAGELDHFEQEKLYRKKNGEKISARVQSFPIFRDGEIPTPETMLYAFSIILFERHNKTAETVIRSMEARIQAAEIQQRTNNTLIQSLVGMLKGQQPNIVINNDNQNENSGEQSVEQK